MKPGALREHEPDVDCGLVTAPVNVVIDAPVSRPPVTAVMVVPGIVVLLIAIV